MSTPTLVIKAKRIITHVGERTFYISAFNPTKDTIKQVKAADEAGDDIYINLDDEMGLFSNGHLVTITDVRVSDDGKCLAVEATKP